MRDKWLLLIFIVGLIFYATWTLYVVAEDRPLDYYQYYIAVYALRHGENIYEETAQAYDAVAKELGIAHYETGFRYYPILTALAVLPTTYLPPRVAATLWVFGSGLAALLTGVLLGRCANAAWKRRLILAATIGFVPIVTSMHAGQVNGYVLLSVALAVYALRQAHDPLGGGALAFSLWLKPYAIALVGLLVWRERWRALIGLVLTTMAILPIALLVFGPAPVISQFRPGGLLNLGFAYPTNQNFNGLVSRWFMPHDYGAPLVNAPQLFLPFYLAICSSFALITFALLWPLGARSESIELQAAILIVLTHLVFPTTWFHHLSMTFIAFAVLIERWGDWRRPGWDMAALAFAYLLLAVYGLFWHRFVGQTLLLDLATWAEVIIFALLGAQLWRLRRPLSAPFSLQPQPQS